MTDCCSNSCSSHPTPERHVCPANGRVYREVSVKTIMHHIKEPWAWEEKSQRYYFCEDPECEVVYFGQDNSIIERSALRTKVGIKEKSLSALVCYCFGVSYGEASKKPGIKQFVTEKTRNDICACETRNPSGKCCLKEFPVE
jgi:hypothetical protein